MPDTLKQPFQLGRLLATPAALAALQAANQTPLELLHRHQAKDWGDVCKADWKENDLSVEQGFRILSADRTKLGVIIWIITEADRSVTTLLL